GSPEFPGGRCVIYNGNGMSRFANMGKLSSALFLLLINFGSTPLCAQRKIPAEIIDYHQHLYSPEAGVRSSPGPKGIDADDLIAQLDAAGIQRAVVLSVAYDFSNPNKPPVPDEYAQVVAENNWTSVQISKYPGRLIGFCGVNPLRPYAIKEIARCAKNAN